MIVEKFNGEINFISEYKKGSTFFFTFEVEDMPTTFTMEPNMDMEEPSFTEMAEDTFTSAMDTLTDMFNMDMPEDMSEEVATEVSDRIISHLRSRSANK